LCGVRVVINGMAQRMKAMGPAPSNTCVATNSISPMPYMNVMRSKGEQSSDQGD